MEVLLNWALPFALHYQSDEEPSWLQVYWRKIAGQESEKRQLNEDRSDPPLADIKTVLNWKCTRSCCWPCLANFRIAVDLILVAKLFISLLSVNGSCFGILSIAFSGCCFLLSESLFASCSAHLALNFTAVEPIFFGVLIFLPYDLQFPIPFLF